MLGGPRPDRLQPAALRARAGRGQRRRPARPLGRAARRPSRARARRGRVPGHARSRAERGLRVQEHGGRRTFVSTTAASGSSCTRRASGSRSCSRRDRLPARRAAPARRRPDAEGARALASCSGSSRRATRSMVGGTLVRFLPGGPRGGRSCTPSSCSDRAVVDSCVGGRAHLRGGGRLAGHRRRDRRTAAGRRRVDRCRGFGAFAGLHSLDERRLLAASTDSVGTKLIVARERGRLRDWAPTSRRTASTTW